MKLPRIEALGIRRADDPWAKAWPIANIGRGGLETLVSRASIDLVGGGVAGYEAIYRSQPWVAICVNKLARGVARLPLKAYGREGDDRTRLRDHPLPELVRRPYPRSSRQALMEATVGSVALFGNALWAKWRPRLGQPPAEVWPLDWRQVEVVGGSREPIDHYVYRGPAGERRFNPDDVVHFRWWAPSGDVGVSPLEPLRVTLTLEDAAQRDAIAAFRNAVSPSATVSTDATLTEEQRQQLMAVMAARHQGPENARRVIFLENGLKIEPFGQNAEESRAIEFRHLTREEVAAVYDIPPPIIGILDRATFSNVTEQHRMFYMDTLAPWLGMIEEALSAQLIEPERAAWGDAFLEFDLAEVLKGDVKERSEAYARWINAGVYTPNELRALENRPALPGGDDLLVPQSLRRATSPDTTEEPAAPPKPARNGNGSGDPDLIGAMR